MCCPSCTVRGRLCSSTLARNSLRDFAYVSRVIRESRLILSMLIGEAIGHSQEGQGMAQLCTAFRLRALEPFLDVVAGELAIGCEVVGLEFGDLPHHGPADLERRL